MTDGNGTRLGLVVSRANRAEIRLATATMEQVRVPRRRGRPRKRPRQLIADKAYDCDDFPVCPPGRRRLLVRYERLISVYAAFFTVACLLICLRMVVK